ncbi:MAG: hypothetical protein JWP12_1498 [Bacteroidetes bacterium]|nr:hypothetical protein [Bacteroidota bacterium]
MAGRTFMIVDDDTDDRFFFRKAIDEIDSSNICQEACNGQDALDQLRKMEQFPDFIFLDLNMYIMNGKECLAELKKDERLKKIPVIIYSTSLYAQDIENMRKLGAVHYLAKPFDITKLSQEITAILAGLQ